MAFSDFKSIADVQKKYQIKYREEIFIVVQETDPPESFRQDLAFFRENMDLFSSEGSRSEMVIAPLLREIYKKHYTRYSFWVQKNLVCDEVLTGTPDYIFSGKSALGKTVLEKPFVIIIEAKKNDFTLGWGQCLAELVAAQKLNEDSLHPVYGIVTDGNLWQFGKLTADVFIQDPENFTIDQLSRLYGALNAIIQFIEQYGAAN